MRLSRCLPLLLLSAAPMLACADDLFTLTQYQDPTQVITFVAPSTPTIPGYTPGDSFSLTLPITDDGVTSQGTVLFFPATGSSFYQNGGLDLLGLDLLGGNTYYDETTAEPNFLLGSYNFIDNNSSNVYELDITQATVTPEPSSLLLLASGLLGTIPVLRRRRTLQASTKI